MTRVGWVVDFAQTLYDREVVRIFNEEADTVLELARRLATDWSNISRVRSRASHRRASGGYNELVASIK